MLDPLRTGANDYRAARAVGTGCRLHRRRGDRHNALQIFEHPGDESASDRGKLVTAVVTQYHRFPAGVEHAHMDVNLVVNPLWVVDGSEGRRGTGKTGDRRDQLHRLLAAAFRTVAEAEAYVIDRVTDAVVRRRGPAGAKYDTPSVVSGEKGLQTPFTSFKALATMPGWRPPNRLFATVDIRPGRRVPGRR